MPQPRNFRFQDHVTKTGNGHYQVTNERSIPNLLVSDVYDHAGDKLGQLGDISNDTVSVGGSNFTYVTQIMHGIIVHSNSGYSLFSIDSHAHYYPGDISTDGYYTYSPPHTTYDAVTSSSSQPYDIACYATGTMIATSVGQTAVEALAIGDRVLTASGALRPIKWIGTRGYSSRFLRNNPELLPIVFKAGCIADTIPARDLYVSPKHAMFLDGVLIAAEELVNGVTVLRAPHREELTYWHIELDSHDVLLAEGAPSESFVDDDSRGMFHNARTFAELYDEDRKDAVYCAPRVVEGHTLHAVRQRLAERAGLPVLLAA